LHQRNLSSPIGLQGLFNCCVADRTSWRFFNLIQFCQTGFTETEMTAWILQSLSPKEYPENKRYQYNVDLGSKTYLAHCFFGWGFFFLKFRRFGNFLFKVLFLHLFRSVLWCLDQCFFGLLFVVF